MAKAARAFASASTDAFMNSLRVQGIAFHGPFRTPRGNVLFLLQNHLFLELELFDLLKQSKLNREGIEELVRNIQASNKGARP
jgi:hypothetical protein